MRAKLSIYVLVAVLAVAAVAVGIVAVAGAGQSNPLPPVSAQDLLARMAQHGDQTKNVSGDVSWQDNLLGDLTAAAGNSTFGDLPAKLPLASSGSGRIWMSDAGAKVESQANGGDQVVVANAKARDVWMYDSAADTAKHIVVTGKPPAAGPRRHPTPGVVAPEAIAGFLQRLAPLATVEVSGQGTVAGRDAYVLTMTPTATDTALGSVQAAIDGETYLPLRLQVFAKGDATPVLEFVFTSISYDPIAAATFEFTPPAGAEVTTKTVDLTKVAKGRKGMMNGRRAEPTKAQRTMMRRLMRHVLLTVPEAQKLVRYKVYAPQGYTARPFDMAAVVGKGGPMTALGKPMAGLLQAAGLGGHGMMSGGGMMGGSAGATSNTQGLRMGPTTVLVYGKGFGTIALAETKATPALEKQIKQLPALVDTATVNGATVRSFTTPLGGVYVWQKGNTTLVAGGMVPKADLQAFVSSVH